MNSSPRQTRWHGWTVVKLSNVRLNVTGSIRRSRTRTLTPRWEISTILQPRAPGWPLKNSSAAPSMIEVRDTDRRSKLTTSVLILGDFAVLPTQAVVPAPNAPSDKVAGD